ncbi:uncharacterized protein LOC105700398 [Orussus abietinus]|uniref:uncharacterized protein LOC105700398 n=1 Tax=Orussus abietinus TaxID=222816 RepID=UPI000625975A|nr:uncharacterized protein LOC105700398 [Orussus abietinus]
MNNHCWRNAPIQTSLEDDAVWPELCRERKPVRKNSSGWEMSRATGNDSVGDRVTKASGRTEENNSEFPVLRETMARGRRKSFVIHPTTEDIFLFADEMKEKAKTPWRRRPKRTDRICIDLREALENHDYLMRIQTDDCKKIRINVCRLKLDPLKDCAMGYFPPGRMKHGKLYIEKVKRLSKLKQAIIEDRKRKKKEFFESGKCNAITRDIIPLDLSKLKIEPDPNVDINIVQDLNSLTLYSSKDWRPQPENLDERFEFTLDIANSLKNLIINDGNKQNVKCYQMDGNEDKTCVDLIGRTLCLNISDGIDMIQPNQGDVIKHSKRFREYCTNTLSPVLDASLDVFLAKITSLQKKLYERNNIKGRCKRRYYAGIRETEKHVKLNKVKFVVITPDMEKIEAEGGLDDAVYRLIDNCKNHAIAFCFGLDRRKLGYLTHGRGLVSCIGIVDYSNAMEELRVLLEEVVRVKNKYQRLKGHADKVINLQSILSGTDLLLTEVLNTLLKILAST